MLLSSPLLFRLSSTRLVFFVLSNYFRPLLTMTKNGPFTFYSSSKPPSLNAIFLHQSFIDQPLPSFLCRYIPHSSGRAIEQNADRAFGRLGRPRALACAHYPPPSTIPSLSTSPRSTHRRVALIRPWHAHHSKPRPPPGFLHHLGSRRLGDMV